MDFQLTSEQAEVRERARAFAAEHVAPYAAKWDREEIFPEDALRECAARGLTGLTVPAEVGGPGASTVSYALAITEIASACSATAVTVAVSSMVAETISRLGTPEQAQTYLPALLEGRSLAGSFALSEPGAGSDAGSLRTKGIFEGDDLVINGEKSWISSGTHAGVFVVWVRTGDESGTKGISTYLVEPGDPGFRVGRKEDKMGLRASTTVSLEFSDCRIPTHRLLGTPGKGFRVAMQALDGGRIGVASQALGIARRAIDTVDEYVRDTNKTLTDLQKARLAKLKADFASARLLTLQAAWLKDQKMPFSDKAAMAKAYSTETANRICQEAVALLGVDGCTDQYPAERLLRDCKVTTIYEGTSEVQRIVISRALLRQ
jgi:alkylation response protein AidB-like acyl-CoA dehydrogenase